MIRPTGIFKPSYTNILHAGLGRDVRNYGDRIPLISFKPDSSKLHVCSAVNSVINYCYNGNTNLALNTDHTVVVEQVKVNGGNFF